MCSLLFIAGFRGFVGARVAAEPFEGSRSEGTKVAQVLNCVSSASRLEAMALIPHVSGGCSPQMLLPEDKQLLQNQLRHCAS
jgi:hypothetical protein